jgi:hypothetical protein
MGDLEMRQPRWPMSLRDFMSGQPDTWAPSNPVSPDWFLSAGFTRLLAIDGIWSLHERSDKSLDDLKLGRSGASARDIFRLGATGPPVEPGLRQHPPTTPFYRASQSARLRGVHNN